MPVTLRKILEAKGARLQDTIYCRIADVILDFPMDVGNFFKLTRDGPGADDFEPLYRLNRLVEEKKKTGEYQAVFARLQHIETSLKEMKGAGNGNEELVAKKLDLRRSKKDIFKKKTALEKRYFAESLEELGKGGVFDTTYLVYKNYFYCSSFAGIAAILPQIKALDTPKLKEMPLFIRGIRNLSRVVKGAEPLGIVGGPCLFGAYEVTIDVYQKDGAVVHFDFSTGRKYDENNLLMDYNIESYFSNGNKNITQVRLKNNKIGVTCQEYLSMQYLFEFALALGARIVIPIPDMSYMKFFKEIMEPVEEGCKERAFKAFEIISQEIADMYLRIIDELRSRYPGVECRVLHSRDTDLCDLFYEKRERYIHKIFRKGQLTVNKGKTEAVVDYITMLALPFYIYGTRNVLQIDSVDEADSMHKCINIHGSEVSFHSILFPEYLSRDGVHTVYYAPLEFKDYINFGG